MKVSTRLWSTALGAYLNQPHSYLAMTRKSEYLTKHVHAGQEGRTGRFNPGDAKYFIVYPFLKTR